MANGRVEQAFSVMKVIKTDRRNCLGEDHLDDLMRKPLMGQHSHSGMLVKQPDYGGKISKSDKLLIRA